MRPGPSAASLALALLLSGCGLEPRSRPLSNQPPDLFIERPTVVSNGEQGQSLRLRWKAHDPDGRVDHYVFALDPASVDRVDPSWSLTRDAATFLRIPRRAASGGVAIAGGSAAEEPHRFAVRAVDDAGEASAPATMAFFGANIAPEAVIVSPEINPVFTPVTPPELEIRWSGRDLDGHITKYKYRLFGLRNPDFPQIPDFVSFVLAYPDFLRIQYAPSFASWDSTGPDTPSARYTGLTPNQLYLFAVTAFDDAGDYDPIFSASRNLLKFAVTYSAFGVPHLCVKGPFFDYCPPDGRDVDLAYEVPAGVAMPVTWFANSAPGSSITGYRWVLDPLDPDDEKQRTHPNSDPNHWTPWGLDNTSATVGPFLRTSSGGEHVLHVQARDSFDRTTTMRIRFTVARPTFAREVLIVDDTRLALDQRTSGGGIAPPSGLWPTAAELDTFLCARGGYPWQAYPAGTMSAPGIFDGYDFDTLGTRGIPDGVVPLSTLCQYRQVIWMTDQVGATFTGSPLELLAPITSLRFMSQPGYMNTLSAYVAQGGRLWLCGGGAAAATLIDWDGRGTPPGEWIGTDPGRPELVPGRFMYDFAHWRSAVSVRPSIYAFVNTADFANWPHPSMGRGWSGHGMDRNLAQPNYGRLLNHAGTQMQVLATRNCAGDPPSPLRSCNTFGPPRPYFAEYLGRNPSFGSPPNAILEDADPRPNHERLQSTLDTLYLAPVGSPNGPLPVMTNYHGFESGPVVFSGFPIWIFQRAQCAALVDFVLQDIWGLPRSGPAIASRRR